MQFFLGTTNPNKVREIGSILFASGCTFTMTSPVDPEETEDDFEGNALLKARAYARDAGALTISEDSGLIIPALQGLPGPWSARFSDCTIDSERGRVIAYRRSGVAREELDVANNAKVLDLLSGVEQPRRSAAFKVVLAVADPNGTIHFKGVGESYGWIADEARGTHGFGYDAIFIGGDTYGRTYAELDSLRKNLRSHRKRVLDEFQAWLGQFLKQREASG